jgi:hypothetical protein
MLSVVRPFYIRGCKRVGNMLKQPTRLSVEERVVEAQNAAPSSRAGWLDKPGIPRSLGDPSQELCAEYPGEVQRPAVSNGAEAQSLTCTGVCPLGDGSAPKGEVCSR